MVVLVVLVALVVLAVLPHHRLTLIEQPVAHPCKLSRGFAMPRAVPGRWYTPYITAMLTVINSIKPVWRCWCHHEPRFSTIASLTLNATHLLVATVLCAPLRHCQVWTAMVPLPISKTSAMGNNYQVGELCGSTMVTILTMRHTRA